jgi:hypothetical protein
MGCPVGTGLITRLAQFWSGTQERRRYFGRTGEGLPGLPGGGMTGVVPGSGTGAGTVMLGVVSEGGVMTPSVRPSLSLSDPSP